MKKFIAFALGLLFVLQTTVAFAATDTQGGMEPAISGLLGFSHWLGGEGGADYVNQNVISAAQQALNWNNNAKFSIVNVTYPEKSCSLQFGSVEKDAEVFLAKCVDLNNEKVAGKAVADSVALSHGTFRAPAQSLRTFFRNILQSPEILWQIRNVMQGTSDRSTTVTLGMVRNEVRWTWKILDVNKQPKLEIYTNAMDPNGLVEYDLK